MSKNVSQFRDSRWQRKRLELLEAAKWTCESCGDDTHKELHVHHKYYEKGAAPWQYPDEAYEVLCDACHETITNEHSIFQREYKLAVTRDEGTDMMLAGFCRMISSKQLPAGSPESHEMLLGMIAGLFIIKPEKLPDFSSEFASEIKRVAVYIGKVLK